MYLALPLPGEEAPGPGTENGRLKKSGDELTLDRQILKEVLEGTIKSRQAPALRRARQGKEVLLSSETTRAV